MKQEIIELFTKRVIDFSLLNWLEIIIITMIFTFIYAVIKNTIKLLAEKQ